MELNSNSHTKPVREKSKGRIWFVALSVLLIIGVVIAISGIMNRGLHIEAEPNHIGVTLEPASELPPSLSTQNDASPIVIAPGTRVETKVTSRTRSAPSQTPPAAGISTTGAASPIVTGQGAVVTSTVDTRP